MINCINIEKKIKNKLLFKNFSLNMEQGDCILISGKSGCGKSTFLNLISLKDNDYEGTILYEGKDIRKLSIFEKILNKKIENY